MTDQLVTIQELQLKLAEREAEHRRSEKLQTALYEIADAASAVTDMHVFYTRLHTIIGGLMYAKNIFIATLDAETGMLSWPYHVDEVDVDESTWSPAPYRDDKGATSYVMRTGKSLHGASDAAALIECGELELVGTLSQDAIMVPLQAAGRTIGALGIQSYTKEIGYTDGDVQVLTFVAQHISTALTRARAIEETLQRNNELAILNSVGEAMAKSLDIKTVTRIVGDKVRDIFNSDGVSIMLLDSQSNLIHTLYEYDKGEGGYIDYIKPFALGTGLTTKVIQSRESLLLGTLEEQGVHGGYLAPESVEQGSGVVAESWLGVPIIVGDKVLGIVSITNYRAGAFGDSHRRLLQTLSSNMGVAIENARLFEAEQQRIAELQIINSIQQGLASKLELQAIIDLVGDKLREVLHTEEIGIRLYDEQADIIHYLYEYEHGERLTIPPMKPSSLFYEVQQHRLPVFGRTLDISQKYGLINVPGTEISKSMATVPILAGNKVIGGIAVENYERQDAFNESNVRLMQTIASSMGVALENARLFDETQRLFKAEQQRAAELAIVTSVQDGLASKLDMRAIYDLVGDKIREVFDAQVVSIMTYDRSTDLLTDRYAFEKDDRTLVPGSMPSFGFRKHVIQTREPLLINRDVEKASIEYDNPTLYGAMSKSNIFVPMIAGSDVTGVVSVQNLDHEDAFTDSDVGLLQTLANSMSVALENARLFDEVQKSNREISEALEQQKGTGEILRVIAGSPTDIQPVLVAVAEHAARLCQANDVQIYQLDGNSLRQVTHFGPLPALQDGESLPLVPGLVTGRAVLERRTIHVEDMRELSKSDYPESVLLQERLGHRTAVSTPLLREGKAIGAIVVRRNEVSPFTGKQIALLSTFADQAAIAIENVRLFNETTRLLKETEQRAAELSVINSVQQGLASKLDMQAIYDLVGDRIRDIFGTEVVYIAIRNANHPDQIDFPYYLDRGHRLDVQPVVLGEGITSRVIQSRQPVVAGTMQQQRGMGGIYDDEEVSEAYLGVPIFLGDVVIGVASVQSYQPNAFSEADVRLLSTLAASMGVALENARLFDETQRLLKETEQRAAELQIINAVQEGLASQLDFNAIVDLVGDKIRGIFDSQITFIGIYHAQEDTMSFPYVYGPVDGQVRRSYPATGPLGGFSGQAVRTRLPVVINRDMDRLSEEIGSSLLAGSVDPKSAVYVPIQSGEGIIGVISLQSLDRENAYPDSDVRLLQTLANSMSVALENARLFGETQRLLKETEQRAAELAIINSVQEGLASKLEMQAIYDLVGDKIRETFRADTTYIVTYDAQQQLVYSHYYMERDHHVAPQPLPYGRGLYSQVIRSHQPILVGTLTQGRELGATDVPSPDGERDLNQSGIYVPITLGDQVMGVVSVQSYKENTYGDSDVHLLTTLANSMSVALENARLFDETQRLLKETEQRAAELAIINSVQEGLASKLDIEAIYELVGEKIRDIFDAQSIIMATFDSQQRTRHITYNWEKGTRYPGGDLPFNKLTKILIQTRQPVVIEEGTLEEIESFGMVQTSGTEVTKSGVWMPLLAAGQVSGMVSLQNVDREHAFSESDVRLLQTLTSSMGVALENARLFDETQRLLKETEQRNAELAVINSVQGALAAKLDIQAIYDAVGGKVSQIFPNADVGIRIYDPVTNLIHFPYTFEDGKRIEIDPIGRGNAGITNHVLITRAPLMINQNAEEESAKLGSYTIPGTQGEKSALYVPLVVGEQARGLISLIDLERENAFADSDVRLLTTVANSMSVALENARLFDETQRLLKETEQRAAELAIINSVQEGLASKLDMQAIYDLVGDKIRQVFDAQSILIDVFDHERQTDRIMYGFESGQRVYDDNEQPFNTLVRHLVSTRQPVTINENALEASRQYGMTTVPGTQSPKSLIFVPFGTAAQVNGHFSLQNIDREHAFSESDVRLLQTLAGSMGIALENARLFKAEQQRAAELSAISAVSQALVAETDLDKMIELIGEKMRDTFSADIAYVALLDRTTNLINFPYAYGDEFPALTYGEGLTSRILQTGEPLLINRDIDKRRAELGTQRVGKQAASYLGVPITAGRQSIGVISVQSISQENAFGEDDLRLLSTIAANAGAAIRTAQLHTETQRRAQEMAVLAEIGNDIAASRELEPVLERIAQHAKTILHVRDIAINLKEPDGQTFRTAVALGKNVHEMKSIVVTLGQGITGHILQSGRAEFVNDSTRDPRRLHVPGTPEEEDERECLMGAPLTSRGETIGGIMVWRERSDGLFAEAELDFLVSVARQTAIAIESARLYLETQRRANEMSALAEVGREISSSLEPAVVLEKIAARARELLAASSSAVFLLNPDKSSMQAITALGELEYEIKADAIRLGEGIIGSLALEGRAEFVNDTSADPRAIQIAGTEEIQQENLMVAPLFRGNEVTGMMAVWRTVDPFNETDLNFLVGLSRQAAIALENARLFEEIKRQGQYLETIFSNSPVAIVTVDETGEVLSWSPAAEKLFGYTREEALGRNVDDLVASSPEIHKEASEYTLHGMDNQYVHRITKRTRKDGRLVDVDLSALPLPLEGGKTGVVAIYNDVGEIQRQRQYYEAIVQNSPVAIVAMDEQSNVVSWNPGAEQLFGYTRDEALGRNIDEMVATTPELRSQARHYNAQAISQELHVITRRTRKDNSEVEVELSGVPLPLPTGKSGLVAIYHDITELQRARQEAISANEAKSAFLATMSHEIRTPMNAVIGMSGLLMDTQLSKEQHDYAETIRNSGDALLAIINDILDFSKIEAGKMDLERQPFDLRECVESALDLVAGRAVEKNLDLAYIIDDDVPVGISGDVTRLRQILLNLMSNAVKFTARGEVVLTVRRDKVPGRLLFAVRDSGIGIAPDRMGRLFESFSQADSSTTRRFGGTGLGLAISKRLAELMGGAMWVESPGTGKGSTFSFSIAAEPAKVAERKTNRDVKGIQPALQGKRVLIVDDNATNRRILMLQTEKWGMAPRETEVSREALKWLKSGEAFNLVILDVQMPEMDGIMLARELRRLKDRVSLPIILLTSLGRKEAGAEDLSVAAYLTKPLKPSALFDALAGIFARNLIAPRAEPAKAVLDADMARDHPLRILLAEDNAVNQKLALRLLQQMGYRADVASNGLEAVESVERQSYDVVLMDVQMPEMDGLDATRAIRKLKTIWQPRVVAMTANAMQGDREMCIAAGMDDYISKPIRVAELVEALTKTKSEKRAAVKPARKAAKKPAKKKALPSHPAKKVVAKKRSGSGGSAVKTPRKTAGTARRSSAERGSGRRS